MSFRPGFLLITFFTARLLQCEDFVFTAVDCLHFVFTEVEIFLAVDLHLTLTLHAVNGALPSMNLEHEDSLCLRLVLIQSLLTSSCDAPLTTKQLTITIVCMIY